MNKPLLGGESLNSSAYGAGAVAGSHTETGRQRVFIYGLLAAASIAVVLTAKNVMFGAEDFIPSTIPEGYTEDTNGEYGDCIDGKPHWLLPSFITEFFHPELGKIDGEFAYCFKCSSAVQKIK
ncbi:MAG: hypothetical protein AAB439_03110 [Patescibacteria group bacterium]